MRYSQAFIPTLKEAPAEATQPSHVLLLRGGFVRQVGAGIYDFLPLGHRVLGKVAQVVRQEMNAAGAQEVLMPGVLPAEYLRESGRWDGFGDILLKIKDRKQGEYALGPTHEEIITDMVRRDVRSYRQLPINLYQIQMKFRDEPRPRAGLLRCREFLMKDAYSFDVDEAGALASYATMREAYRRIFKRLGLDFRIVAADSGAMGGDTSAEFQILAQTGEDDIVACGSCDFAANVEVAPAAPPSAERAAPSGPIDKVATPGAKTIDEVVEYLNRKGSQGPIDASRLLKSLVYVAGSELVLVVVRGDHQVNEVKLAKVLRVPQVFLASEADVAKAFGTPVGFVGPVGHAGRIVADHAVWSVADGVCGANEKDAHLVHVAYERDFRAELLDLRSARDGDPCPRCGAGLRAYRGIEGGHIFVLGTHYSAKMGATFLDEKGESKPIVMGCYGIGVSRLVAAAIEQHHDADGILWPMPIAPYHVIVTTVGKDEQVALAGQALHDALAAAGVDVLLDDRDERPGVKFKDADLLGIPLRATVGGKGLARGMIELKARDAKAAEDVTIAEAAVVIAKRVQDALAAAAG
ncbi:MAG: proline--tRNA ligase [Deltaproteobacteria bacterium]|nr:proline--tRNA ligase [Deltaproteobacteria bacterium]